MNPISKVRNAFISVDQQLKQKNEQIAQLQRQAELLQQQLEEHKQVQEQMQKQIQEQLQEQRREQRQEQEELLRLGTALNQGGQQMEEALRRAESEQKAWRENLGHEQWMTTFGYDGLIANLQLDAVEQRVKGNRHRLESLRNTHVGETCFVIGNGPSLKSADLDKLHQKGVYCFAAKRINQIFSQTSWRPQVWGASDLDYISACFSEIEQMDEYIKLLPCQTLTNLALLDPNALYYPFIQAERMPPWFSKDVTRGVHFGGSITFKLIAFAVFMGFQEIYLLGVDNSYPRKKDENGIERIDLDQPTYFEGCEKFAGMEQAFQRIDATATERMIEAAFRTVQWHAEHEEFTVYNATRGGRLEVFPRRSFDDVIQTL